MITDNVEQALVKPNHQRRFIGDLPSGWHIDKLVHVADVTQGVSKGREFDNKKVVDAPYLRVANVLDSWFDLGEIKTIELLQSEQQRYLVKKDDILITEGGDPDKLGRGAPGKSILMGWYSRTICFGYGVTEPCYYPIFWHCTYRAERRKITSSLVPNRPRVLPPSIWGRLKQPPFHLWQNSTT